MPHVMNGFFKHQQQSDDPFINRRSITGSHSAGARSCVSQISAAIHMLEASLLNVSSAYQPKNSLQYALENSF
jgi:hypothetical protein